MGMYWWFPLCPFQLNSVDPSFMLFLRFWPCIAVKRKLMHWNISLLVLDVTTILLAATHRAGIISVFARIQHSFHTWFVPKWRKWVLVWFPKLRHTMWLEPCPAELGSEPNTAPLWCDFWNFNRPQKKEYLTKSIYFFRRTTKLTWTFQLGE